MNFLPKEIEDIINDYSYQIEHSMKFESCLNEIKNIRYQIYSSVEYVRSDREDTLYKYYKKHDCILITENKYDEEFETFWIKHLGYIQNNKYVTDVHMIFQKIHEMN